MVGNRSASYNSATNAISSNIKELSPDVVSKYITVIGSCQTRVQPTDIRLIWAVTSEQVDPSLCMGSIEDRIKKVRTAWKNIGVEGENVVEDFISAIPKYAWKPEDKLGQNLLVEHRDGLRMQSNLHVHVKSNKQAMAVVKAAFSAGLTDLIGVDYSADLETIQQEARSKAIAAAKKNGTVLFTALFDKVPKPINVQEKTTIHLPKHLYHSFTTPANSLSVGWSNRLVRIHAARPQNTYYSGVTHAADIKSYDLPMNPEIIVESKVILYYRSPGCRTFNSWKRKL